MKNLLLENWRGRGGDIACRSLGHLSRSGVDMQAVRQTCEGYQIERP
jgi:hypothetical protein